MPCLSLDFGNDGRRMPRVEIKACCFLSLRYFFTTSTSNDHRLEVGDGRGRKGYLATLSANEVKSASPKKKAIFCRRTK